jgi:hypothetical protein
MLVAIVQQLDDWVATQNIEARAEGLLGQRRCRIRLLGQMALVEAEAPLHLVATNDVDAYTDCDHATQKELERLLVQVGKTLDPLGQKIWMPRETQYRRLFQGLFVTLEVADVDAVLVSKALKAPQKNRSLLTEYLARGPSPRFLTLARKYKVDLEQFL